MDIHKPKPVHSVREFLSEIGVIVVGIAIARSGEQAIEALHWRHVSEQTERDLDKELGVDLTQAAIRLSYKDCLKVRLAELRDKLASANDDWKADPIKLKGGPAPQPPEAMPGHVMPIVHGLPYFSYSREAWETARASGALDHLPHDRLDFYASSYEDIEALKGWQAAESASAVQLAPLAFNTRLEHRDRDAYLADLAAVDSNAFYLENFTRILLERGRAHGIHPARAEVAEWIKEGRAMSGGCVKDVGS